MDLTLPDDPKDAAAALAESHPELVAQLVMTHQQKALTAFLNEAKFDPTWTPQALAVESMRRLRERDGLDHREILVHEGEAPLQEMTTQINSPSPKRQLTDEDARQIYERRANVMNPPAK